MLLDQLKVLNSNNTPQQVAEQRLSSFFGFASKCMKEGLLKMEDMLTLFEDLYECCQEAQLTALFPLFERAILGSKLDGSERMELKENQRHTCTKICRIIMTKLTVTHDLQLRGTLLRFVARTLPLTHPSGKKLNNSEIDDGGRVQPIQEQFL